jgi:hypothetical protein
MGQCNTISTKVAPEPPPDIKTQLIQDYDMFTRAFLEKPSPKHLTMAFCKQHRTFHDDYATISPHDPSDKRFEAMYETFVDTLIELYEFNHLTIEEELRQTTQIKQIFAL